MKTFEITIRDSKLTIRTDDAGLTSQLAARDIVAVKRGYTAWVLYEGGMRCGSVVEL